MSETPSTSTSTASYHTDPTLYLYTSLTAGSSHIITATSRLETILKANKIAFRAIDVATDEKARMLWGRRSKGRRLPGLVRYGMIIGDLVQIEEWNEYRELKRQIANTLAPSDAETAAATASPPISSPALAAAPSHPTPSATPHIQITNTPSRTSPSPSGANTPHASMLRQASREAAAKAKESAAVGKKSGLGTSSSSQAEAEQGVAEKAVEEAKKEDAEKGMDEKEKEEAAEEKLKSAQRRASVVAMGEMQRPGLEGTAVESAADIRVDDAVKEKEKEGEKEGGEGRSGRGAVSATRAGEKEEVARDLRETAEEKKEEEEKGEKGEKE